MFDNPTDNHTDIEVPLYDKLRFTKLKTLFHINVAFGTGNDNVTSDNNVAWQNKSPQLNITQTSRVPFTNMV